MSYNSTKDILNKYGAKIENEFKGYTPSKEFSKNYEEFRGSMIPNFSRYEKWCKALGGYFSVTVGKKDRVDIERNISIAHLDLTASEVFVFSLTAMLLAIFGGGLLTAGLYFITGNFSILLIFLAVIFSIFLFYYSYLTPKRLAQQWRLKASAQMVPAILYVVIYMKHTSNFEKAISFAAEHLDAPLSLDLRKVFWDVEVGRYSTIKESVDHYLETWRDYSVEFIEAFHLIESSLYEPSEGRRVEILERSLQVILDGVYDKMLKYTHDVKSPLTNIYMLGVVLPTLSLAILPLASSMLQGVIKWYHVMLIFNLIVPVFVLYLTSGVMLTRPGGYGDTTLLEKNPLYPEYKSRKHYWKSFFLCFPLFLIGLIPLFWMYTSLPSLFNLPKDYSWDQLGITFLGKSGVLGIINNDGALSGPFGVFSLILSLFIPLSIALFFSIAFSLRTKELIKYREQYKGVEQEFTSSLFQLGNRIGDGLPAEIAFSKVAESSRGTATEGFFRMVNQNIQQLGMSLEQALFNPKRGAVIFYPSQLVETSMRILLESVKKGLKVAARSLMSISDYVKNIRKIDERLNDLLADIISDMKSNMTFLAPLLSGIVIGLAGMITTILASLKIMFDNANILGNEASSTLGVGGLNEILRIFDVTQMIPPYWLQIVVGIYILEIVFILSATLVTIKSGKDDLEATAETGKNLRTAMILYFVIALFSIIGLTLISSLALAGLTA